MLIMSTRTLEATIIIAGSPKKMLWLLLHTGEAMSTKVLKNIDLSKNDGDIFICFMY